MKRLLIVLLAATLVASYAWAHGISRFPSDNLSGGGSGNVPFSWQFGGASTSWPAAASCLRATSAGGAFVTCTSGSSSNHCSASYESTPYLRRLTCSPSNDSAAWNGTGTGSFAELGVYEITGGGVSGGYQKNLIGSTITFTNVDALRVSKSAPLNQRVSLPDATLNVCLVTDDQDGATVDDIGFNCTIYGHEG